tara:strand:+ start:1465 stop:2298 length:834 start_codon:yes stop_codon:yes gene_type:complete
MKNNIDKVTVEGFGDEWERFDQSSLSKKEQSSMFEGYFSNFPWDELVSNPVGFDLGCGSGRWAKLVAPKVGKLHCIDPSSAIDVARKNLIGNLNCEFHKADVDSMPLKDGSMDFGYSLGVLHHVPDTQKAMNACVNKLKPGAPFLLYLYYSFDNRPFWFRSLWKLSDLGRAGISRMPYKMRYLVSQIIAIVIYFPMVMIAKSLEALKFNVSNIPLSAYRNNSFYTMRTDALDRFGTRLEKRFSKVEINKMMEISGLEGIKFSNQTPYWCAVGVRKKD